MSSVGEGSSEAYATAAEFIDVAMTAPWQVLGPRVEQVLAEAGTGHAPVVDVGAGTGRGLLAAARALPRAAVVAVEPSAALRAVLLSRAAGEPGLLARTTVVPLPWSVALSSGTRQPLPGTWGAALALAMTGHLEPRERRGLFSSAARRLAPGGPLVVSVQPPTRVEVVPEMQWGAVQVGDHTYSTWGSAEPAGTDSVLWHITYRVHEGGRQLREARMSHQWFVHGAADVAGEMEDAGLTPEVRGEDLVVGWQRG